MNSLYGTSINDFFQGIELSSLSIPVIRISDVVDILIVAIFIYIILNWIRETRAWSLLKGIIIIIILSLLSFRLNLYTTYWLIEKALSIGILALLILFQPEFRKGLEQIGKGSLTKKIFSTLEQTEKKISKATLEEILDACFKMSKRKLGAIIAIEQSVALGDFQNSGVAIDAVISSQLLVNIFEDKTPLHDGAVIIRNDRIARAACILPLTESEIGLELGTRHRATVGISEISDAYVFVVSEETGKVSVAHNGKLMQGLSREDIENMLNEEENAKEPKYKIWKGWKS